MEYLQYFGGMKRLSLQSQVLNLIINGIPSIPYESLIREAGFQVLNLIINGIPSILDKENLAKPKEEAVLNLIINGIPSILKSINVSTGIVTEF